MAFPIIVTNRPIGTQRVSTIDDFERETRSWLKLCMQTISGYPDVGTVGVMGWTSKTRPSKNQNDNYLLGYNTQTSSLELIGKDGDIVNISGQFALVAHPVGEYYYTSNPDFDPNIYWGGTWERVQDGRVLISANKEYMVGEIGGEKKVTLTERQIPIHDHVHTHKHSHTRGTMNIVGSFSGLENGSKEETQLTGAFYQTNVKANGAGNKNYDDYIVGFDASKAWEGKTSEDGTVSSESPVGSGAAHNNMQPYRVAICWHRVA